MSTESDLLQKGVVQLETGDRRGAAKVFIGLLRQNPHFEMAWWRLSACVDRQQQKRDCYERILEINPLNKAARAALELIDRSQPDLVTMARTAESNHNYELAYQCYAQLVSADPACAPAWLGKGFNAGMLSTPEKNGVREFYECLDKGLRVSGMTTGDLRGMSLAQSAILHEAGLANILLGYLQTLFDNITGLAVHCTPNMANIFTIERVHLADWLHFIQQGMDGKEGQAFPRERLFDVVIEAFDAIAVNIRRTTRGRRSRLELLGTFRYFLLSNLEHSKLNQDSELLGRLDEILARNV
jgi:tetratricopeptide (TPR) repeat protein